jgi:hypothetical protein
MALFRRIDTIARRPEQVLRAYQFLRSAAGTLVYQHVVRGMHRLISQAGDAIFRPDMLNLYKFQHARWRLSQTMKTRLVLSIALCGIPYLQFPRGRILNQPVRPDLACPSLLLFAQAVSSWCPPASPIMPNCSAARYAPNATVAMPRPGKEPLKRLKREKGPVYRHCSLSEVSMRCIHFLAVL